MLTAALLAASLPALARAQVLFEGSGYRATVYYDLDSSDLCSTTHGGPFPPNWAITSGINHGYLYCNDNDDYRTLSDFGTNRIVALSHDLVSSDKAKWCGKEVQIFNAAGDQIVLDEGPFIVWDSCEACNTAKIIDLSAKGLIAVSADGLCRDNPEGISFKVLDNDIRDTLEHGGRPQSKPSPSPKPEAAPSLPSGPATLPGGPKILLAAPKASKSSSTRKTSASTSSKTHKTSASTSSKAHETSASTSSKTPKPSPSTKGTTKGTGACTYGKWQCDGLQLQVCDYVSTTACAWKTVATCSSKCEFSDTGSAICL